MHTLLKKIAPTFVITLVIALAGIGIILPPAQAQTRRATRVSDRQVELILRRVENRSNRFRRSFDRALDRSRLDDTSREDDINNSVKEFEDATDQLRSRFNDRAAVADDVENVLSRARLINDFLRRNRLNSVVQRDWSYLRADLTQLARTYNITANFDARTTTPTYNAAASADARFTGTYRLDVSRSDNPNDIADRATRSVSSRDRQRIRNEVFNRLTPPDQIAIERRGRTVIIASTRAPQVTLEADGRERFERYPNNRAARVNTRIVGDQLTVSSLGDRNNDFTINFDTLESGRRMLVTRRFFAERINQPIVLRSYYDRTSDVAQFNLYDPNTATDTARNTAISTNDFYVPNNTLLTATLNTNLSTQTSREGDRFTMTVREPNAYEGATLEGYVSNVERSGRVTGRSTMTLNFERIRLRDNRAYRFAGALDTVQTSSGETVRVDNEGTVRDDDNQTNRTVTRTGIGAGLGALIGAIAGGGKGAAIGAAIGAGTGAGSVYVQGRDDLNLTSGTQVQVRASAPRS